MSRNGSGLEAKKHRLFTPGAVKTVYVSKNNDVLAGLLLCTSWRIPVVTTGYLDFN
jgi:hypothetical protein